MKIESNARFSLNTDMISYGTTVHAQLADWIY